MKLLFVQIGNYADAYRMFLSGEPETYRDQKKSVDFVASLTNKHQVTTIAFTGSCEDVTIEPGLRSIGVDEADWHKTDIENILDEVSPDAIILRTPHLEVLDVAINRNITVFPCFADIFHGGGVRNRFRMRRLRNLIRSPNVTCVGNHSTNASRSVAEVLNCPLNKIVPWDWSKLENLSPPKSGLFDPEVARIFFAGSVTETKGVGDCIDALHLLKDNPQRVEMTFAGLGDLERWKRHAAQLGLIDRVNFLGSIPNTEVRGQMTKHDIVVVPSRHSYPEGLPNVIYEGLASGSPLLVSDHPAFEGRIIPDEGCVQFKASDPADLADAIKRLASDHRLYARLTQNAKDTLSPLYVGMQWCDLIQSFVDDPKNEQGWVEANSLAVLAP